MPKTPTKKELTPREKMLLKLENLKKLFENTSVVSVDSNIKQIPWSEKLKEKISTPTSISFSILEINSELFLSISL
jgi:hypothetical protein